MNRCTMYFGEFVFEPGARRHVKKIKPAKQQGAKATRQAFALAEVNDVQLAISR